MKSIVILVVLGLAGSSFGALSEEFIQKVMKKMQEIGEVCQKETGATDDDIAALLERKVPESHEGKCMISCFGAKLGIQDGQGHFSEEGTRAALEPMKAVDEDIYNKMLEVSLACAKEAEKGSGDVCQDATEYFQCTIKKEKELGYENGIFS